MDTFIVKTMTLCGKTDPPVYPLIEPRSGQKGSLRNSRRETYDGVSVQWFTNGSFQATGVKDISAFHSILERYSNTQLTLLDIAMVYVTTQIVPTNLSKLRHDLQTFEKLRISYDWERFKGLIVKESLQKVTILVYRSGKVGIFAPSYDVAIQTTKKYLSDFFASLEKSS